MPTARNPQTRCYRSRSCHLFRYFFALARGPGANVATSVFVWPFIFCSLKRGKCLKYKRINIRSPFVSCEDQNLFSTRKQRKGHRILGGQPQLMREGCRMREFIATCCRRLGLQALKYWANPVYSCGKVRFPLLQFSIFREERGGWRYPRPGDFERKRLSSSNRKGFLRVTDGRKTRYLCAICKKSQKWAAVCEGPPPKLAPLGTPRPPPRC